MENTDDHKTFVTQFDFIWLLIYIWTQKL